MTRFFHIKKGREKLGNMVDKYAASWLIWAYLLIFMERQSKT
jgi:hypothetical protein